METRIIVEGRTRLEIPDPEGFRTASGDYAPSLTEVFYNPRMELCRDISVAATQVLARTLGTLSVCDPLAGVGARGIRYANEVEGVSKVVANDWSQKANGFITHNAGLNQVEPLVEIHQKNANILMLENHGRFNFIDLDPFGSPAPFLNSACTAIMRKGAIAVTATDTASLCGAQVPACIRRYGARPLKTEYYNELGVRILVGFAQRVAAGHELALTPLFSHATQHYFRAYFWAERGARKADEVLKNLGHVSHCFKCGRRSFVKGVTPKLQEFCACGGGFSHAGPLWLGQLSDRTFVLDTLAELSRRGFRLGHQAVLLLSRCAEESDGPPTFYDVNEISKLTKISPPKLESIMKKLAGEGYFTSRTHFSGTGFRTDTPFETILASFRSQT
jgi:tRNA (guanine26-N2/guanine27-N2)-dimethyltransferase